MATIETALAVLAAARVSNAQAAYAHAMRMAGPIPPGAGASIETARAVAMLAEEANARAAYEVALASGGARAAPTDAPPADVPPADVPPAGVDLE